MSSVALYDRPVTVAGDLLLWNARLIDGRGGPARERTAIEVRAGRIEALTDIAGATAPDSAIDVAGRTVLPGLIDAHNHVMSDLERSPEFGPRPALHGEEPRPIELRWFVLAKAARALLRVGITTVRDVGSYDDEAIVLREAVRLGLVEGPRILSCGRIISATAPGARIFGTMYREADGPWEMRQAVRAQIRRGADYVKVMATGARSVEREDRADPIDLCPAAPAEQPRQRLRIDAKVVRSSIEQLLARGVTEPHPRRETDPAATPALDPALGRGRDPQ